MQPGANLRGNAICSRCGFQLAGVSKLLLTNGESLVNSEKRTGIISHLRQKNALVGAKKSIAKLADAKQFQEVYEF